jgi:hypothetical protein
MIEHVVVAKAKPGRERDVDAILADFTRDIGHLPGLIAMTVGPNFHQRSLDAGVTHGMLVRLADQAALNAYQVHPIHAALLPKLNETCIERLVLDWVAPDPTHAN